MISYQRAQIATELKQILSLQRQNLKEHISEEEIKNEGFVTVHHNLDLLRRMNEACPHIIAKDEDKVVGYALCMHPKFGDEIDVLKPMFTELDKHRNTLGIDSFVVMGQVCIDKAYRRQGIFRKLYETMKKEVIPPFDVIITEVNATNIRSKKAHEGIGFKRITTHEAEGQIWELIYLK